MAHTKNEILRMHLLLPENAVVLVNGVNGVEHRFQSLNSAIVNGVTAWYVFVGRLLVHGE